MSNSAGDVYLFHVPSFFCGVRVAHLLLLLCMYFMFFVVYVCFLSRVFVSGVLLADLSLHSNPKERISVARSFNLSFRYIDDVLSLDNPNFGDLMHCIYHKELEKTYTTDTVKSVSYLDLHIEIDGIRKLLGTCVWSVHITTHTLFQSLPKLRRLFVSR